MAILRFVVPVALVLMLIAAVAFFAPREAHSQSSGTPITGYAWSDTIGWISLNCATGGPTGNNICSTYNYGLSVNSSGTISGYAWSDNIGWISANPSDLTGCPSGPCTATIQNGELTGWLKALAADDNDWDGWISLSGSGYGPQLSGNTFTGYAWGSENVGWVDFEYANYSSCTQSYSCSGNTIEETQNDCVITPLTTCTSPQYCSAGSSSCLTPQITFNPSGTYTGNLQVIPQIVQMGQTVQVFWNVSDAQGCSVTGSNGDGTASSTDSKSPGQWNTLASPQGGETTSPIAGDTTYTLSCQGYSGATPPSVKQTVQIDLTPLYEER